MVCVWGLVSTMYIIVIIVITIIIVVPSRSLPRPLKIPLLYVQYTYNTNAICRIQADKTDDLETRIRRSVCVSINRVRARRTCTRGSCVPFENGKRWKADDFRENDVFSGGLGNWRAAGISRFFGKKNNLDGKTSRNYRIVDDHYQNRFETDEKNFLKSNF